MQGIRLCPEPLLKYSTGLAAGDKLTIDGGSAGGYTALACMTFANTFVAATSYYGVSDLIELAKHTHKFESE